MRAVGAQMMCLRNDVPLRGNGGEPLSFAARQSAVRTGDVERAHLLGEKDSRKKSKNGAPAPETDSV